MLNANRRRGETGKQEAATLQLTSELLELDLTQIESLSTTGESG